MKSMLKRSWLSIIRKPSKTIVLGIILFVMANLVLASLSIGSAVEESTNYARRSLGSTVYLNPDMEKMREQAMANAQQSDGQMMVKMQRPNIPLELVMDIANSEHIKDFTYGINSTANAEVITPYSDSNSESNNSFSQFGNGGNITMNRGGDFRIVGINSYAFISEVKNNSMKLVEGEYFDEGTNNKIIISIDLANENDLTVGDVVTLLNYESGEKEEVEIIGIFEVTVDGLQNTIYMNVETAAKFLDSERYNDGNYSVDNVEYFLTDPELANQFIEEANNKRPDLKEEKLLLELNNDAYESMVGPIEAVGSFASTILWIVIIASILIIALIINGNIKDRKYEMGVLMSIGATKKNILGQITLELIIIGTVGFLLSIGTSYFLASGISQRLLDKQIEMSKQEQENNFGRPAGGMTISGGRTGGPVSISGGKINHNYDTIDTIDVSVSIIDYTILFGIGYLIIIFAMIVPAVNIIKYEPKTVLTRRD